MEYLLRVEDVEKLKGKLIKLEEEASSISSEIKQAISEDREFLNSDRYKILKTRIKVGIPHEKEKIENKLKKAKIIADTDFNFDGATVSMFTKVTLDYEGEIEVYSIFPVEEDNINENIISCEAPISKLILGKKIGDVVNHRGTKVKIINVEKC